jgi:hypothetical protein
VLFQFQLDSASVLFQCSLKELSIASMDTTFAKTAIQLVDTSDFILHEVTVGGGAPWKGGVGGSIGIQMKGRDLTSIHNCSINAERPIVISKNPNVFIDADHYRIRECILITMDNTYPCVKFDDGIYISNFIMEDVSLNRGLHGVQVGAAAATSSQVFALKRIRWEQSTGGANSYAVRIDTTGMQNVRLEQVSSGNVTDHSGFYFRGIDRLTLDHCDYTGTGKALDIDGTVQGLVMLNTYFHQGTVSLGNLVESFSIVDGGEGVLEPARRIAFFADSSVANVHTRHFGVRHLSKQGSLGHGASVNIPLGAASVSVSTITVSASGSTDHEGGVWMFGPLGCKIIAGTANTDDANTANHLCVIDNGDLPALVNNLGETVQYVINVVWQAG